MDNPTVFYDLNDEIQYTKYIEERNQIEPTKSRMEENGVYFGFNVNSKLKKSNDVPKYSFLKDFGKRVYKKAKSLEEKIQRESLERIALERDREAYYKKIHSNKR
jgi:hypothetical protein